ncbi:MAG: caspase domain-containing protein, partial [Hyphomicrobiaceae bacterium]
MPMSRVTPRRGSRPLGSLRQGIFAVLIGFCAVASPAAAEKRVALVVGNSAYRSVPTLANPRNDAEDIATALKRLGFETTVALDADRAAMERAVEEFATRTETADVALFYYAGHGIQHQGLNYLVPTDANLQNAAGIRRLVRLDDIVSDARKAKALRILVLDACRDNPFADVLSPPAQGGTPSRSTGLAKLSRSTDAAAALPGSAPAGASRGGDIVVYSAEAGRTASDGAGRNSPFTSALLRNVETEGQEVVGLMRRIAISVQNDTGGEQRPELLLSVPFEFYFKPGAPKPPPTVAERLPKAKKHEVA